MASPFSSTPYSLLLHRFGTSTSLVEWMLGLAVLFRCVTLSQQVRPPVGTIELFCRDVRLASRLRGGLRIVKGVAGRSRHATRWQKRPHAWMPPTRVH